VAFSIKRFSSEQPVDGAAEAGTTLLGDVIKILCPGLLLKCILKYLPPAVHLGAFRCYCALQHSTG
jgi:hypothetical protein